MTSEGQQPADRATDTAASERGGRAASSGLFEAPEVPETFATFTPSRHAGMASPFPRFDEADQAPTAGGGQGYGDAVEPQRLPDEPGSGYTHTSSGFSGFPPDPVETPSSSGVYVPAPAVMPIPNPAVSDEELPSWSSYSQNQAPARPAYEEPQQSWASFSHTPPPTEEPQQPVVSWAAYTPAEEPAASAAPEQGWAAFTGPTDQPVEQSAWSGFASAAPPAEEAAPAWGSYAATPEPAPQQPAAQQFQEQPGSPLPIRQPEEPEQQTGWSAFTNPPAYEQAPAPAEAPADQSWTSYEPAESNPIHAEHRVPGATLEGSWPAFSGPHTTEPDSSEWQEPQAAEQQAWPAPAAELPQQTGAPVQPVEVVQPAPVAQGSIPEQPTRASASVPVASRLSPPTEPVQPARTEPRVYGAARPAEMTDEPVAAPVTVEPIVPHQTPPPAQESTSRPAVARASVSVGRASPADVVPPPTGQAGVYGRPQSTVYGSPAAAAQAASAQVTPADAPPANVYGGGGSTGTLQGGGLQAQPGPAQTSTQRGGGMPPYGDLLGPASPQPAPRQPTQLPNTMVPAQRGPDAPAEPTQERFGNFKPVEEAPATVRSSKVLFIVIGACLALLGIALGTLWVVGNMMEDKPTSFGVGQCVKQEGTTAVAATCTETGAFTVTEIVAEKTKCPDTTQPTIEQANGILCLKPAGTP